MKNKAIYLASMIGNSVKTEMHSDAHTGGNILSCVPRKGRPPLLRISELPQIVQKYVIYKYVVYNMYIYNIYIFLANILWNLNNLQKRS